MSTTMSTTSSNMRALLEAFFTHGEPRCSGSGDGDDIESTPSDSAATTSNSSIVFLHGPAHAGQTSLLLQFGFTQAKRGQRVVLVLCGDDSSTTHKSTLVRISPCLACGVPTQTGSDNLVWQHIQIKYIRSSTELQHFLCSFHLLEHAPSVLLIDGLERFFSANSLVGDVYQTLAYAYETLRFMQTTATANGDDSGPAQVVVTGATDSAVLARTSRAALRRWCAFLQARGTKDDDCEFELCEELEDELESDDDDDRDADDTVAGVETRAQVAIRYEYAPPVARQSDGVFRLLRVESAAAAL